MDLAPLLPLHMRLVWKNEKCVEKKIPPESTLRLKSFPGFTSCNDLLLAGEARHFCLQRVFYY